MLGVEIEGGSPAKGPETGGVILSYIHFKDLAKVSGKAGPWALIPSPALYFVLQCLLSEKRLLQSK